MRPVALGRKNWLHVGSPQSGPKVAAILSVVESCRRLRAGEGLPLSGFAWHVPTQVVRGHVAYPCPMRCISPLNQDWSNAYGAGIDSRRAHAPIRVGLALLDWGSVE
jgi:hypothetical protein